MVTTRRQQEDGDGKAAAATARRRPAATATALGNGGSGAAAAATLTPEEHRARLDEYRAAWAPPKTIAGRLHAWVHEHVVYGSALIGITMLDVGERVAYLLAVALVLGLVAAGGFRQGARLASALRGTLMAWASAQQQQQQQQQAGALGGATLGGGEAPTADYA